MTPTDESGMSVGENVPLDIAADDLKKFEAVTPAIVPDEEELFADDNFEEGDSLVGEKYVAPAKDEKFIDVHKGTVIDKKDVSPLLQIKAFFESTNTKYREPRSGCGKCYGRGYTGFNTTTQAWIPCRCM